MKVLVKPKKVKMAAKIAKIIADLPEVKEKSKVISYPKLALKKQIKVVEQPIKTIAEMAAERIAMRRSKSRINSPDSIISPTRPNFDIVPRKKPLMSMSMKTSHPKIAKKSQAIFHVPNKKETFVSKVVQ